MGAMAGSIATHASASDKLDDPAGLEQQTVPMPALGWIIASLCVVSFLAAFDNIIVATNTPLVAAEYQGFGLYGWVNTAFLLTAATSQPLYGRCVDTLGRRRCFLFATACYFIGTILCAAAQNMIMVIVARAMCGIGVGAFDTLMKIVVADYIPVRFIGIYQAMLGISWGLGYVVGALLGGAVVTQAGWRAVFWMALGLCALVFILVYYAVQDKAAARANFSDLASTADLTGLLFWSTGVVCLVLSLSWGGSTYAWNSAVIIALLSVGVVLLAGFGVWEHTWADNPMVPRGILANRSTVLILVAAFMYGGCFQSLMTYVPLYLSVIRHEDAMASNLELLCLVLIACICNVLTGYAIVKSGRYVWAPRVALSVLLLACGLLNFLRQDSGRGLIVGLMIVAGIGSGGMINSEIITAQASVPVEHVPSMVAFMTFCDQMGGITGITVQGAILFNVLTQQINTLSIPNVSAEMVRQSSDYVWQLAEPTRSLVLDAYMTAVRMAFWGSTAFAAAGLLATAGLKAYVMRTHLK